MIINENKINDQIKIKNILIKYKTTAYKLTTEEIQYFYHKQNLQYLSKQQQKNAVFANEVKNKVNNCFFEQIKKHLTNCAKTLCKDNEMNDNKALSKAIAKRKTTFGVIKNKILWVISHFINKNITYLQIAYACECSLKYVQKIFNELKALRILFKAKLFKEDINNNKTKLKHKYYLIKYFDEQQNNNWVFQDKRYWQLSKQEMKEIFEEHQSKMQIEDAEIDEIIANIISQY